MDVRINNKETQQEKLAKFEGSIAFRAESAKRAFDDLKVIYEKLNSAMSLSSGVNGEELNVLGRQYRYVKYATVLELAGLFDKRQGTLSVKRLGIYLNQIKHTHAKAFNGELAKIEQNYSSHIGVLKLHRDNVAAHAGEQQLDQILYTNAILDMPISSLIKEIRGLLLGIQLQKQKERLKQGVIQK